MNGFELQQKTLWIRWKLYKQTNEAKAQLCREESRKKNSYAQWERVLRLGIQPPLRLMKIILKTDLFQEDQNNSAFDTPLGSMTIYKQWLHMVRLIRFSTMSPSYPSFLWKESENR